MLKICSVVFRAVWLVLVASRPERCGLLENSSMTVNLSCVLCVHVCVCVWGGS